MSRLRGYAVAGLHILNTKPAGLAKYGRVLPLLLVGPVLLSVSISSLVGMAGSSIPVPPRKPAVAALNQNVTPIAVQGPSIPVPAVIHIDEKKDRHMIGKTYTPKFKRNAAQNAQAADMIKSVRRAIQQYEPSAALRTFNESSITAYLDEVEKDRIRAMIASGYLFAGKTEEAEKLSAQSLKKSRGYAPLAGWVHGLSKFRLGQYGEAAQSFEIAADSPYSSGWMASAAAYWAARSHEKAGQPGKIGKWLKIAAEYPHTFYGLLALQSQGKTPRMKENMSSSYPLMPWSPKHGYRIDRALIHAIVRQESRFDPNAENKGSGATGLMQLMPSTAKHVAKKEVSRAELKNPETSLGLGQKYVEELLNNELIGQDLLSLAMAYNAGPGTLAKWKAERADIDDPLLFIETIPFAETRAFVERVMANYWMYRMRFDQPNDSMIALAEGRWARYAAHDKGAVKFASAD